MMKEQPNVVIYKYSSIASYMLERFIDDQSDSVVREGDNIIFTRNYETRFLVKAFTDYITDFFCVEEEHPYGKQKTIVVGTCYSHHNWKCKFIDQIENNSAKKFIKSKVPIRYAFSDRNFMADESLINQLLDTLVGKLMRGDITVNTPDFSTVKFVFVKDVSESDISSILKSYHSYKNCYVFPNSKAEILFDINKMVYKSVSKSHKITSDLKDKVLYMYELACSPEEDE